MTISGIVNGEMSVRGSNVGTRQDLQEAIDFAARSLARATITTEPLENVNAIFARMKKGEITPTAMILGVPGGKCAEMGCTTKSIRRDDPGQIASAIVAAAIP